MRVPSVVVPLLYVSSVQLRRRIIPLGKHDGIGECGCASPVAGIMGIDDSLSALCNVRQPVGGIIGVADAPLRSGFGGEAVQMVIGARDGAGEGVDDLDQTISCIIGVTDRRSVSVGHLRLPVQGIIGEGRDLALAIGHLNEMACQGEEENCGRQQATQT